MPSISNQPVQEATAKASVASPVSYESILVQSSAKSERQIRNERLINNFARVTQFLMWPLLFVIFRIVFRIKIDGRERFKSIKRPFLIISNHISFYDSFLFRLVLGFWTPHLPLRFMAVTKFEWRFLNFLASIGIIQFIYSLFGVFTVYPGMGIDRNLAEARDIIKVGGNIVIYPEGKIFVHEGIGGFKKGAAVLIKETGVLAVPVSFHVTQGFIRRIVNIRVGEPIHFGESETVESVTQTLHDKVEGLYSM